MKMLKKLAALILAATMVLVLFTACGGDTPSTPEAQAEAQMMSTINKQRGSAVQLCNDTELKQEAEKFLDSAVDINTGAWKIYNAIDVHRDDNGVYTAKVVVKNEYTGKLLEEFFKLVNNKDTVEKFVKNAYQRNMKVYLLTGEKTWLYEDTYQTAIYRVFDKVAEYNSMVDYDARLAGVSYDVEVWTNSDYNWKNNADARAQQVKFVEAAQQYANEKNLSVIHCLPFWIVRYDYTDEDGTTKNVYDSITQIANDTILMTYRDSASAVERLVAEVQTNAEHPVLYYAEKNDCNLEIAVQVDQSKEGDSVSFYEEEQENPGCVKDALATIQTDLADYSEHTTFAIHQAIAMYEFYLSK